MIEYRTNRLIIKRLTPGDAAMVLDFYNNNREHFEEYETDRPTNFYTKAFQEKVLALENADTTLGKFYRYYFFLPEDPHTIIGTVSFSHVVQGNFKRAVIGYKTDKRYLRNGYSFEAITFCLSLAANSLNLHRIEAYVHANNTPSSNLLKKAGFFHEGTAHEYVILHGNYVDLERYVILLQ